MTISGPGAGYRPQHYSDLMGLHQNDAPRWLEILSENFMGVGGTPLQNLLKIREKFPLCMHGVSMSIAGQDRFEPSYLTDLKYLMELIEPIYVSDHLCWTSYRGHNSHDLLPVSYTVKSLEHVCERIQAVQDFLKRPLLFENPSAYVAFSADQMSEAEFLAGMCQRTGCGLLLDVNNLYVNHKNLGTDVISWLNRINPKSVGYIHMAGHSVGESIRIDTHDARVSPEVWDLYSFVSTKFGSLPAMIEWDGDVPDFSVLQDEVVKLKEHATRIVTAYEIFGCEPRFEQFEKQESETEWQQVQADFFSAVVSDVVKEGEGFNSNLFKSDTPAPSAIGSEVYTNAYLQRLAEVLQGAFPVLYTVIGAREFRKLSHDYFRKHLPSHYSVKYACANLREFEGLSVAAQHCGVEAQLLIDLVSLEWTIYDLRDAVGLPGNLDRSELTKITPEQWPGVVFRCQPSITMLPVKFRVDQTIETHRKGQSPSPPTSESVTLMVRRDVDCEVSWDLMSGLEITLFTGFQKKMTFENCCTLYSSSFGEAFEDTVVQAVRIVGGWLDDGIIDQVNV